MDEHDPYVWLEEVLGERALAQVRSWNERTLGALRADPRYSALEADALAILEARDKIPYGQYRAGRVVDFWQDADHVRGLLRWAPLDSYLGTSPAWTPLLDLDELARQDGENWVFHGATRLAPEHRMAMLALSRGGKDAAPQFEWDLHTGARVNGGFELPEAKTGLAWEDPNTLLVSTDWGPGTTTESGYPFVVKRWRRGQPLPNAVELFRGEPGDVGVWPRRVDGDDRDALMLVQRAVTFFEKREYVVTGDALVALPLPLRIQMHLVFADRLVFHVEEDWTPPSGRTFGRGTLLALPLVSARTGSLAGLEAIYEPGPRETLGQVGRTRTRLVVTRWHNVRGAAYAYHRDLEGRWVADRLPLPELGSVHLVSAYPDSDVAFFARQGFLDPDALVAMDVGQQPARVLGEKPAPARFDAHALTCEQHEVRSADGTAIPYFLVRPKGVQGPLPTILYGYGGFQVSLTPNYAGVRGKLWLERGGALALANIRGGGEFGPGWHQAALKGQRQRAFDDFIAIATDLVARGVTSPRRLAAMGGSNGGLLVGAMYVQRPDLFHAVICQVPLLDMLRFHELLAGASWIGEYGDPRIPEERAFLATISPYHHVRADVRYPEIFFLTSTKDDRVHPAHARKMAAKLEALGHPFSYYENIDGGHSAAANLKETARRSALEYCWLARKLVDGD